MKPTPSPAWDDVTGRLREDESDRLLIGLRSCDRAVLAAHFPVWAHEGQVVRPEDPKAETWRTWIIMAGRGFGKTLAGAQWITAQVAHHADTAEPLDIALVGATIEDARRVMVEGRSGLLHVAADRIAAWHPSLNQLIFKSGATATLFSGASPDRLRGPEHHLAWCDELAKWERAADSWDMLQLGLRLGERPRALITTTPKAGPLLTAIIADPDTLTTRGSTLENPHISPAFKARVHALYAGTRLGRQELDGELLTDTPGALWTVELLEKCRKQEPPPTPPARAGGEPDSASSTQPDSPPSLLGGARGGSSSSCLSSTFPDHSTTLIRVVIGVDPPIADGTCGIIACALDDEGIAHVLADHSVTARTPEGWASAVATAAAIHGRYFPLSLRGEATTPQSSLSRSDGRSGLQGSDDASASVECPRREGDHPARPDGGGAPSNPPLDFEGRGTVPDLIRDGGGAARALARAEQDALTPTEHAAHHHPIPTTIVAETNQGGRMVKAILLTADPHLHVKPVTAHVGKADRAAPIAHLFEAGKVVLHGRFPELEAQLCGLIAGGDYQGPGGSPDRADAMVWALTELTLKGGAGPRVRTV